jgi:hypothetical protein
MRQTHGDGVAMGWEEAPPAIPTLLSQTCKRDIRWKLATRRYGWVFVWASSHEAAREKVRNLSGARRREESESGEE